ncbi:hypothetical protein GCM10027445_32290 [Amycolatopsis endophytica]|uniref:Uncharacterized protein n=1 Tax=Amycolatopsis endophytica TaxID=860233 RepID=A0A853B197_9PSEU|nr:hypothetical protein [Amycolatopsis endophytica]NYI88853.1 hypothetical protein [Amycolatopsis endophytica]
MLIAKRTSRLGRQYTLIRDGRVLPEFVLKRRSAQFTVDDSGYSVRLHRFSRLCELFGADGAVLASTDRVGWRWNLHASGQDYEFRQTAMPGREYTMAGEDDPAAGTIQRNGPADSTVTADLPLLKPELEAFVLVAVLLNRRRKRVAAGIRGGVSAG